MEGSAAAPGDPRKNILCALILWAHETTGEAGADYFNPPSPRRGEGRGEGRGRSYGDLLLFCSQIPHGDHADHLSLVDHRQVAEPVVEHRLHRVVNVELRGNRFRAPGHPRAASWGRAA